MTTAPVSMREAWGARLIELGQADPRTVVVDADLASSTKADGFARAFPGRFIQAGIAEQHLIGLAAGLAQAGFICWTSSFAVFLSHRALDPIRVLLGQDHANVKLAGSYSGLLIGGVGKTHIDVEDLAIMRAMPGMVVLAPADVTELTAMIDWAHAYDGPVYLRLVRNPVPDVLGPGYTFTPGAVLTLRPGSDLVLAGTGPQTGRLLAAAGLLAGEGISARVVHVPCLKPLDAGALRAAVDGPGLVVTAEEHSVIGGLGSLVAETLTSSGPAPWIERLGIADTWGESAGDDYLLRVHGLTPEAIARHVTGLLARPGAAR